MIGGMLRQHGHDVVNLPMCDGGEYTYDVLKSYFHCEEEVVSDVLDAGLVPIKARYLAIRDEAYVISSEIIRLSASSENKKNPILLSDYGLGQVVLDALNKKYKVIHICLGGVSTVGLGLGFSQALGAKIFDHNGKRIIRPIIGRDLKNVGKIEIPPIIWPETRISVLADGILSCNEMGPISRRKIGADYFHERKNIEQNILEGINNIFELVGISKDKSFTGVAGGMRIGIDLMFHATWEKGGHYFLNLFDVPNNLRHADLVVTGEGTLDASSAEKAPMEMVRLSANIGKRLLYICGKIETNPYYEPFPHDIKDLQKLGVEELIVCGPAENEIQALSAYSDRVELFRLQTPVMLYPQLKRILGKKGC